MQEPLDPELAQYLQSRLRRSAYLIPALRQALNDLGHPELSAILELIRQDTFEAGIAVEKLLSMKRTNRRLQTMADLGKLSRLGGPKARTTIHQLAARLAGVN